MPVCSAISPAVTVCGTSCNCMRLFVCRQIELQQEQEAADVCELWNELRQKLLSMFHAAVTRPSVTCSASDPATASSVLNTGIDSVHELIERFAVVYLQVAMHEINFENCKQVTEC